MNNILKKSVASDLLSGKQKGSGLTVIPDAETAEILDLLVQHGILGAGSKREFGRKALAEAARARLAWAKEKGIL